MGANSKQGWYLLGFIVGFTFLVAGLAYLGPLFSLVGLACLIGSLVGFYRIKPLEQAAPPEAFSGASPGSAQAGTRRWITLNRLSIRSRGKPMRVSRSVNSRPRMADRGEQRRVVECRASNLCSNAWTIGRSGRSGRSSQRRPPQERHLEKLNLDS